MQQERQQAGTTPGGGKTTVGVFGFLSRPKKEGKKEDEEKKSVTPESQAVGDAAIGAGPSQAGMSQILNIIGTVVLHIWRLQLR